jgi:hypothetical protein
MAVWIGCVVRDLGVSPLRMLVCVGIIVCHPAVHNRVAATSSSAATCVHAADLNTPHSAQRQAMRI